MLKKILCLISFLLIFLISGCVSAKLTLNGFYQCTTTDGYHIQMSFDKKNNSFVEYIDNREVNKGTYEHKDDNTYTLTGDTQSFEITLNDKNYFEMIIKKINNGESIKMDYIDNTPTYFETDFNDIDKYKKLLD